MSTASSAQANASSKRALSVRPCARAQSSEPMSSGAVARPSFFASLMPDSASLMPFSSASRACRGIGSSLKIRAPSFTAKRTAFSETMYMHAISPSCLPSSRYWTRPFSAKRMADLNSFFFQWISACIFSASASPEMSDSSLKSAWALELCDAASSTSPRLNSKVAVISSAWPKARGSRGSSSNFSLNSSAKSIASSLWPM
mmetsp:Transcript_123593/g.293654  ORF Transcript_123593/g.293654 Transcript_123593/m.293654 type:complete len:201 (+) Transcript_123593:175-777(+)